MHNALRSESLPLLLPYLQFLEPAPTDRSYQAACLSELCEQGLGGLWGSGSDQDAVVGRRFRPAERSVTEMAIHVRIGCLSFPGLVGQFGDEFHSVYFATKLSQNGRLVP